MATDIHQWGFKSKLKWALIEEAPLSDSGLNEIIAAGATKKDLQMYAGNLGIRLTGRNCFHSIIRLDSIPSKEGHDTTS
jgi:hypothetical protein